MYDILLVVPLYEFPSGVYEIVGLVFRVILSIWLGLKITSFLWKRGIIK